MTSNLEMGTTDGAPPGLDLGFQVIGAAQTIGLRHSVLWPDKPPSHVLLPEDQNAMHLGAFLLSSPSSISPSSLPVSQSNSDATEGPCEGQGFMLPIPTPIQTPNSTRIGHDNLQNLTPVPSTNPVASQARTTPIAVVSLFVEPFPLPIDSTDSENLPSPSMLAPKLPSDTAATTDMGGGGNTRRKEEGRAVRFRKLACDPVFQGRGIGTKLLEYTMSIARTELDASVIWCDARVSSLEWYRKRGLRPCGSTFYKDGVEYVRMKGDI